MMQETPLLKPVREITINTLFSPQDAYAFVHFSAIGRFLSIDAVFSQQIMLNSIKARKGEEQKSYAQCIVKKQASYKDFQNERKSPKYPLCQYEDIILFLKTSIERTCDFLRKDETSNFYTEHLGGMEKVLRVKIEWREEYARWDIKATNLVRCYTPSINTILVVPYESHYSDTI